MDIRSIVPSLALGAFALAGTALGQDAEQSVPANGAAPATLQVTPEEGTTLRYRRTRTRTSLCKELARDHDERLSVEYELTILRALKTGNRRVKLSIGRATGHVKLRSGELHEFDSEGEQYPVTNTPDLVNIKSLTMLSGNTIRATLDDQGRVVSTDGVREAVIRAFARTPLSQMAQSFPPEEANLLVQNLLPSLPSQEAAPGTSWEEVLPVDFGPFARYDFTHTWTVAEPEGDTLTISAATRHTTPETAAEGQTTTGQGRIEDVRSAADGTIVRRTVEHSFEASGDVEATATYAETIERVSDDEAESPGEAAPQPPGDGQAPAEDEE